MVIVYTFHPHGITKVGFIWKKATRMSSSKCVPRPQRTAACLGIFVKQRVFKLMLRDSFCMQKWTSNG